MIEKLEAVLSRFNQLTELVVDPNVIARQDEWQKYTKERSDLEELVEKYLEYKKINQEKDDAEQAAESESDAEMKALLTEEFYECKKKLEVISDELKILLLPKDPNDDKNIIMEIRAGAGGDEASLFVYDLYKMYLRFAEKMRWKVEDMDTSFTEAGGMKEAVVNIVGRSVYGKLKFESGVHRVQRVPETESQGRVHTSAATVAVLPEVEEVDIYINPADIKMEAYRSSGAGGQKVNKTSFFILKK